jgi:hypothetical protein
MSTTATTHYGWVMPDPGTEADEWGELLNAIFIAADQDLKTTADVASAASSATTVGATTSSAGRIQLATASEAMTGTATDRACTPASLGATKTLSSTGYYALPGGLIINWAQVFCNGNNSATVSWAQAFPNQCLCVSVTPQNSSIGIDNWAALISHSTFGCTVGRLYGGGTNQNNTMHVMAIGY